MSKTLAALMFSFALMTSATAPAFAAPNNAQDDKNNPTFPGTGAGNNPQPPLSAIDNTAENCFEFFIGAKGNGTNLPAQCY